MGLVVERNVNEGMGAAQVSGAHVCALLYLLTAVTFNPTLCLSFMTFGTVCSHKGILELGPRYHLCKLRADNSDLLSSKSWMSKPRAHLHFGEVCHSRTMCVGP